MIELKDIESLVLLSDLDSGSKEIIINLIDFNRTKRIEDVVAWASNEIGNNQPDIMLTTGEIIHVENKQTTEGI